MSMKNEIINMSIRTLSENLKSRKISAVEATRAYLERIAETEPLINAYITVCEDLALSEADKADKMLSELGDNAPILCGVPYALKDNIASNGVRMTCASRMLENFTPTYSAGVYNKVEKMGAVLLGKNNLDEFAMGSSCEKSYFGTSRNPLDTKCSPGGSSGGSAAAVCAKSALWSLGTDTGGSARQPASFCGVVSMKPTYGLVSRSGVVEFSSSFDTVCPITRSVYDNAIVLSAIIGRDEGDMTSLDISKDYTDKIDAQVRGLRVGVFYRFEDSCSDGCVSSTLRAVEKLREMGAVIGDAIVPSTDIILATYLVISAAEASSNFARFDGIKYGYKGEGESFAEIMTNSRAEGFGVEVKKRVLAGGYALSSADGDDYYRSAKTTQSEICRLTDHLWDRFDVIIMPTSSDVAFQIGAFDSDPSKMYKSDSFTTIANITGCPAITIPSGGDGVLSYGVTLMGPRLSEKRLYRAAYALESALSEYVSAEVAR